MTGFVNTLAMILQDHLLRKAEGTALVRFDGILLLDEGQDFDKRFLCIGTPDQCVRALATAESGCLISAGDSEALRQTIKSPAVNLLVTELPLGLRSTPGVGTVCSVQLGTVQAPAPVLPALARGKGLAGVPVLVVDNDAQALAALAGVLRGWGCQVYEANGEAQARQRLAAAEVALWLFDYNLDDGDTGTALRQRLAASGEPRPTLILSADDSLATRREVLEQGLTLLHKPVRPLALKSVLDRLLAARHSPPG